MPEGASVAMPAPPEIVARIVRAIGVDKTLLLLERHAGTAIYVSDRMVDAKRGLARELHLSRAEAERLAAAFEFDEKRTRLPMARAWRAAHYRVRGLSYTKIALKLGMTEQSVWRLISQAGLVHSPQMRLPLL